MIVKLVTLIRSSSVKFEYVDVTQINIYGNSITISGKLKGTEDSVTEKHYLFHLTSMSVEF